MSNSKIAIGLAMVMALAMAGQAQAQAPALLPVQGYLTDDADVPIDGDVAMEFSIYDADIGGSMLFGESSTTAVERGHFTVYIGEVEPLMLALFRDYGTLWLDVGIEGTAVGPRISFGSVPYAGFAQHCGDATSLGGMPAGDFAGAEHAHAWSEVTGVPADLADGDTDTTYSAGAGLSLTGTTFSVDTSGLQTRVSGTCLAGQSIRAIAADGSVTCETDNAPGPGDGLLMSRSDLAVDGTVARTDRTETFDTNTLHIDATNNRVGIGTTAPTDPLHVASNFRAGGTVRGGGFEWNTPRSFVHSVPVPAFASHNLVFGSAVYQVQSHALWCAASCGAVRLAAPVTLPGSATVTSVRCYYTDTSATRRLEALNFSLVEQSPTGLQVVMASASVSTSAAGTASFASVADSTISSAGTTGDSWYMLEVVFDSDAANNSVTFRGCRINYTLTQVNVD